MGLLDNLKTLFGKGNQAQTMNQTPVSSGVQPPTEELNQPVPADPQVPGQATPPANQSVNPQPEPTNTPPAVSSEIPQTPENQ